MIKSHEVNLIERLISQFSLDLKGVRVLTECASGAYLFSPIIAQLAGAEVYCLGKNTQYGQFTEIKEQLLELSQSLPNSMTPENIQETFSDWSSFDLVINSGMLRPISDSSIRQLPSHGVVALGWEPWEFRPEDLDLPACQENQIIVLGTDESHPAINMFKYNGIIIEKLFMEAKCDINSASIALVGHCKSAQSIAESFDQKQLNWTWIKEFEDLEKINSLKNLDALVFAEHGDRRLLCGEQAPINFNQLREKFPDMKVIHYSGNIDVNQLEKSGIPFKPEKIAAPGYMSYNAFELGPQPVIELLALTYKASEVAVKSRKNGLSIEDSIEKAVKSGFALDFPGGFLNYKINQGSQCGL